jgi:release factor glutamine methyltransferase
MPTIRDEIARGSERLRAAGVADERLTASLLLAHVLGVGRAHLIAHPERELTPDEVHEFNRAVERRAAREPFQHITGAQEFYGLELEVTPDVLVPRPETELIVEAAERLWREERPRIHTNTHESRSIRDDSCGFVDSSRVHDVGTGSGALAVTLALRLPGARVMATDVSAAALAVARRNAARHGARVEFVRADLATALSGPFDLVVSNPPYIPDDDIEALQPEVRDHEPRLALAGGADGLDAYRRLFADAPRVLAPGGHLVCELGVGQADAARAIAEACGLEVVEILDDLQGIPRTIVTTVPGAKDEG